jgi:hypothetical protein
MSAMATMLFFKVGTVFGMDSQALYGVPSPDVNAVPKLYGVPSPIVNEVPALYGVPQPEPTTEFANIFGKIALFVLLPLCIIALITVGIVALVKVNKKKKQAQQNMQDPNLNNK